MHTGAQPVQRGCGKRKAGGIYAELGLGTGGQPVEAFLVDPPRPLDEGLLSAVGVHPMVRDGVTHVLDWIGATHYPNVADFIEEVRLFGLSRRISPSFPVEDLNDRSRILCAHPRAHVGNAGAYPPMLTCPCHRKEHGEEPTDPHCIALAWQDVEGGVGDFEVRGPIGFPAWAPLRPEDLTEPFVAGRIVRRDMPSFSYVAMHAPDGVPARHALAIFGSFPISRLVVVRDVEGGTDEPALDRARGAALPVDLVDE